MSKKNLAIRPQAENTNAHTQRGMGVLEGSIQQYGWIGAPTVAADGESFDGSARLEVGAALGFDMDAAEPQIIESDGTRPIIVRSRGQQPVIHQRMDIPNANDPRAKALGVIANRSAELNLVYDAGVLAGLADDGIDLSGLFFPDELSAILEQAGTEILDVEFREYDESVENEVKYCICPQCGHRWPQ